MPKPSTRRDADDREASKAARRPTAFRIPPPKGKAPGPIPASTSYVPPDYDNESEAFAPIAGREIASGRRAGVNPDALSSAQRRMQAKAPLPIVDEDEGEDENVKLDASREEPDERDAKIAAMEAELAKFRQANPKTIAEMATLPAPSPSPSLLSYPPSQFDIDRLWDWVREDPDLGHSFLARPISTSIDLHDFAQHMRNDELNHGAAMFRSIYAEGHHLGFVLLWPILAAERTALVNLYLRKDLRAGFAKLAPFLMAAAEAMMPGIHLAVSSLDPAWERLHAQVLTPLGFTKHTMFVK